LTHSDVPQIPSPAKVDANTHNSTPATNKRETNKGGGAKQGKGRGGGKGPVSAQVHSEVGDGAVRGGGGEGQWGGGKGSLPVASPGEVQGVKPRVKVPSRARAKYELAPV